EREDRGLGTGEVERCLIVAVDGHLLEVGPPDPARVLPGVAMCLCGEPLRGFFRKESSVLPLSHCQVHCTSFAVKGFSSCHLTPWRSLNVSLVPLSSHDQLSARSGMTVSIPPMGFIGSNTTRPLKTGADAITVVKLASSRIDRLDGLALMYTRSVPPRFCAAAGRATKHV